MSWLMRRNRPKAYAGWREDFNRPDEDPIKQPWQRIGGSTTIEIVDNQMKVGFGALDFISGASYEFSPFTENWGFEFNMIFKNFPGYPAGQPFAVFLGPNWAKVNPSFDNTVGLRWQSVTVNDSSLKCVTFPNSFTTGTTYFTKNYTAPFWTVPHNVRVWIDKDHIIRMWVDGILVGTAKLSPAFWFRDLRRGVNFNNQTFVAGYIDSYTVYDRPKDNVGWWDPAAPIFVEDFARANSATIGNGWVKAGNQNSAIISESWGVNNTNDPVRHIIQQGTLMPLLGNVRIEYTFGSAMTAVNTAIFCNLSSTGNAGIAVVFTNGSVGIARVGGTLASPTYTVLQSHSMNISVGTASKVALLLIGDEIFGEVDGEIVCGYTGVSAISPRTNRNWGVMAARGSFINSPRIDNIKLFKQIGT